MPLEPKQLDDRDFEGLLTEARLRIQRYCPEWTDFNDSDPGTALVQLFAWLTELMIYKLNQVPERNYLTFLKTLNLELLPAQPARTQVVLTMQPSDRPKPQTVPERAKFFVPSDSGELVFETTFALDTVPYPLDAVHTSDGLNREDFSAANVEGTRPFPPLGVSPQAGSALYLGFRAEADAADPVAAFPQRMVLYFFFAPPSATAARLTATRAGGQKPPPLVWEYQSKLDAEAISQPPAADRWRPLTVFEDGTRSLTREGRVVLRGPGPDCAWRPGPPGAEDTRRFWIRCRLVQGAYGQRAVPRIASVRCNVVEVENRATYRDEFLGEGDGHRNTFQLKNRPVAPGSLQLVVTGPGDAEEPWLLRDDLGQSTRNDPHCLLDVSSGLVQFGDGEHGRLPGAGQLVIARSYRAGGGAAGNVAPATIQDPPAVVQGVASVTNPRGAVGGTDEETVEALLRRAPRVLRGDRRAVTVDDYRRLAEEVPGVGRAVVLPLRLSQYPGLQVPGAVTVAVIPCAPVPRVGDEPWRYLPAQDLLDEVLRRLDECRPVGTELVVAAPRYREVTITVGVVRNEIVTENQARVGVQQALEAYFCPVPPPAAAPPGGVQPAQWEVGLPIRASQLYGVVLQARDAASGALLVRDVTRLTIDDGRTKLDEGAALSLERDELPGCHVVVEVTSDGPRRRSG